MLLGRGHESRGQHSAGCEGMATQETGGYQAGALSTKKTPKIDTQNNNRDNVLMTQDTRAGKRCNGTAMPSSTDRQVQRYICSYVDGPGRTASTHVHDVYQQIDISRAPPQCLTNPISLAYITCECDLMHEHLASGTCINTSIRDAQEAWTALGF